MSTTSYDSVFALGTTRVIIAPGATLAYLLTGDSGQNALIIKLFAGGTLEIVGVASGVTLTAAQLVTASGNHYLLGSSEIISLDGPVRCYLQATGATCTVMLMRGKSQGS